MARRAAEEAENHWPGFVDALSTIVMVVTFLLIILAVAIFVLSQNVAKSYIESQTEKTQQGGGDQMSLENGSATKEFRGDQEVEVPVENGITAKTQAPEKPETPSEQTAAATPQSAAPPPPTQAQTETPAEQSAPQTQDQAKSQEKFSPQLAEELKAKDPVEEGTDLSVLSRNVPIEEKRVVVAPLDKAEENPGTTVKKAQSILLIDFKGGAVKIDDGTANEIKSFGAENQAVLKDKRMTIWSFTSSSEGSISQAKRLAYYRALAARNAVMASGIPAEKIGMEIRFTDDTEKVDTVQLVVH